jgi:hypothetical protein
MRLTAHYLTVSNSPVDLRANVGLVSVSLQADKDSIHHLVTTLMTLRSNTITALHISLSSPPHSSAWQHLHAALDQPRFSRLTELEICVTIHGHRDNLEEMQGPYDDLEIFSHFRGFRREIIQSVQEEEKSIKE